MTVVERTPVGQFTWDDIAATPPDGLRREVIGGALIVNPAPFIRHQQVVFRLATILDAGEGPGVRVLVAPVDWRYDATGVVEPDIVVIAGPVEVDGPIPETVTPVLVVEVHSSNHLVDTALKRDLYERLGVAHYWMVDPGAADREPAITALVLSDGRYQVDGQASGAAPFTAQRPVPVSFAPADLLR